MYALTIGTVKNMSPEDYKKLIELVDIYNYHRFKNEEKERYYEGHIKLSDVNLGIALPKSFSGLEIGCEWGAKCVDVLASRSILDGFVTASGGDAEEIRQIMDDNRFVAEYQKSCRDELKFGCTFATLSKDNVSGCRIRFHSPQTASAMWNGEKGRIDCGMAIIDSVPDEKYESQWTPSLINMYTDKYIIVLIKTGAIWTAEYYPHRMGRPLMEPMVWNATSTKPFGRSRIKEPVRELIKGYVRTMANATIGLEFSTSPQKYLMGVTDDQYDAIINDKFKQYIGSILAATTNPETGTNPTYGQLTQGTITPHIEMLRALATQFSAATGLSVTDTGVVNDANPTSSDAILAQTQTLVLMAEQLNHSNGDALKTIARMAIAIKNSTTLENLTDEQSDVVAHFKNPAMPSVATTADAAVRIASSRQSFAQTDVFLEMLGFDQADIRRIKAQEQRAQGTITLKEFMASGNNNTAGMDQVPQSHESDMPAGS